MLLEIREESFLRSVREIYKKAIGQGAGATHNIDAMRIPGFFVYSAADFDMRKPLFFLADSWYTVNKVSGMQFKPFVFDKMNRQVPVSIEPMLPSNANLPPVWQTSWTSQYLAEERFEKYAAKLNRELIALAAYEVLQNLLVVHIVYIAAHPESNPTLDNGMPEYTDIGRLMIAYGIKLSIDNGFAGDVVLEVKTTSLAKHYEKDFGAVRLPVFNSSAP